MNTNNKQNTNNEHLNGQNAEANKNNKINEEQGNFNYLFNWCFTF